MRLRKALFGMALLLAAAVLPLVAQSHPQASPAGPAMPAGREIKCVAADGKTPCTAAQVEALNRLVVTGRQSDPGLAAIRSVSLRGPDGTLICVQPSGAACSDDQTKALRDAAQKKGDSGFHITRTIDVASP